MPLNQALYDMLNGMFGYEGKVSSEAKPLVYSRAPVLERTRSRGGNEYVITMDKGERYSYNCPFCHPVDTKHHLMVGHSVGCVFKPVELKTKELHCGIWNVVCWRNGCHKRPDFREWWKSIPFPKADLSVLYGQEMEPAKSAMHQFAQKQVDLPSGTRSLLDGNLPGMVYDFMKERVLDIEELANVYLCRHAPAESKWKEQVPKDSDKTPDTMTLYEDRLVIPIIQRRRLISWQARLWIDRPGPPKYVFPPGSNTTQWLYNMDQALLHRDVVICEGITDVWRIGPNAVALFGKELSEYQANLMRVLWGTDGQAVIMLDSPAEDPTTPEKAEAIRRKLVAAQAFPRGVAIAQLPQGDPGTTPPQTIQWYLEQARNSLAV